MYTAKLLLFTCLLGYSATLLSQDYREQHQLGAGARFMPPRSSIKYGVSQLRYEEPGYELFYRCIFPYKQPKYKTAVTGSFFYHKGYGYISGGNINSHYYARGFYERALAVLSVTQFTGRIENNRIYAAFGVGASAGTELFAHGAPEKIVFDINNNSQTFSPGIRPYMNKGYYAAHAEVNIGLRIAKSHYIVVGSRQYIESADGFGLKINFTNTLFLAYSLR